MLDDVYKDADARMRKTQEFLKRDLMKIRTGRAHPSFLEHVKVQAYGTSMSLNKVANTGLLDTRTLSVTVFDRALVPEIEKAIMKEDLGLNPVTSGTVIRLPMPPLTEERRKDLARMVRGECEKSKVAVRNIRRDANQACKELLKEKAISEDQDRTSESRIQTLTDRHIKEIDHMLAEKEREIMEI